MSEPQEDSLNFCAEKLSVLQRTARWIGVDRVTQMSARAFALRTQRRRKPSWLLATASAFPVETAAESTRLVQVLEVGPLHKAALSSQAAPCARGLCVPRSNFACPRPLVGRLDPEAVKGSICRSIAVGGTRANEDG